MILNTQTVAFDAIHYTTLLIAVFRVSIQISFHWLLDKFNRDLYMRLFITACWLWGFVRLAITNSVFTPVVYNEVGYYYSFVCKEPSNDTSYCDSVLGFLYANDQIPLIIMLIIYIVVMASIGSKKKIVASEQQQKMDMYERKVLYQSVSLFLTLVVQSLSFLTIPQFNLGISGAFLTNLITIITCSMNPIISLTFNTVRIESNALEQFSHSTSAGICYFSGNSHFSQRTLIYNWCGHQRKSNSDSHRTAVN